MSRQCTFGEEHGGELDGEAVRVHVASCEACMVRLALRQRARDAWSYVNHRDDAHKASARERRIRRRFVERKTGHRARTTTVLVLGLALFGGTAAAMVLERHHEQAAALACPPAVTSPGPVMPRAAPSVAAITSVDPVIPSEPAPPPPLEPSTPTPSPPAARVHPTPDDAALWQAAEDALARGDRREAETLLRALLDRPREASLTSKGELRLAQLLLARGATSEARERLHPLVFAAGSHARDEAMWLYARSLKSAAERAEAWSQFLSTEPAQPMRDLAWVERGSALLEAGDLDGARSIAERLSAAQHPPIVEDARRALQARLDGARATTHSPR